MELISKEQVIPIGELIQIEQRMINKLITKTN